METATMSPVEKKRRRNEWSAEEDALLRSKYALLKPQALLELFPNRTESSLVCRAHRLNIKANDRKVFTPEEDAYLIKHFANCSNKTLAKKLNRTVTSVAQHGFALGLKKTRATWLRVQRANGKALVVKGLGYRFTKGHQPHNAGVPMKADVWDRCKATMFKKGQACRTKLPIGTEVLDPDGYLKRKVSDDNTIPAYKNWKLVHVLLWVQHNGPVPDGHVVTFIDQDKKNIVIENLECISKAERAIRTHRNLKAPIDHVALAHKAWRTRRLRQALADKGVAIEVIQRTHGYEKRKKSRPSRS